MRKGSKGRGWGYIKATAAAPCGVTTFGQPIVSHIDAINQEYAQYMATSKTIRDYLVDEVESQPKALSWRDKCFMYLTLIPYCQHGMDKLMPAEFSFAAFSYDAGLKGGRTFLFDTGLVPFGQHRDILEACEENALPFPTKFKEKKAVGTDASVFFANMVAMAKDCGTFIKEDGEEYIMIFSTKAQISTLNGCLKWLEEEMVKSGKIVPKTKVFCFETLVKAMSRMDGYDSDTEGVILHEGGAAKFIYHTRYDFFPYLACKWHQLEKNVGKVDMCANSITLRRIYNVLFYLSHLYEGGPSQGSPRLPPKVF